MTVPLSDVVFAYDFSRIEVSGGNRYLYDFGPNQFSMRFPGGAADPTPQLDGSLSFDGGDYLYFDGDLSRFYAKMPIAQHTWIARHGSQAVTGIAPRLFSCENGNFGIGLTTVTTTNPGNTWAINNSGAVVRYAQGPAGCLRLTPQIPLLFTMETTPRLMIDSVPYVTTWGLGAYGAPAYDTATIPRIGMQPSGGGAAACRLSYLALIRGSLASSDLALYSRLLSEGSTKPFCVRQ